MWGEDLKKEIVEAFVEADRFDERTEEAFAWVREQRRYRKRLGFNPLNPGRRYKPRSATAADNQRRHRIRKITPRTPRGLRTADGIERNRYQPERRLLVLEAVFVRGLSMRKVARNYDINRNTVLSWVNAHNSGVLTLEVLRECRTEATRIAKSLKVDLAKANLLRAAWAFSQETVEVDTLRAALAEFDEEARCSAEIKDGLP